MTEPQMKPEMNEQTEQKDEQSFENALMRLEWIVKQLESGDLSLEASIESFQEGMKLAKLCRDKLDEAEQKIELLVAQSDGYARKTFTPEE